MSAPSSEPAAGVGASTRARRISAMAAGASLVLAVLLGACTASVPPKADMVDALRTSGIPEKEAQCAADAVYGTLSDEQIRDLIDRGNGGTPVNDPKRTDDTADKLTQAMAKCQSAGVATEPSTEPIGGGAVGTSTTTAPPVSTTEGPAFTTTTTTANGGSGSTTVAN